MKFIVMYVQEEERINHNAGGDSINLAKHNKKKKNYA
jgi:hypothetical protein